MDMNKYLIVAIYMVAGCVVAIPIEDIYESNMSSEIWADLKNLAEEDAIVSCSSSLDTTNSGVTTIVLRSGKILVSSLLVFNTTFLDRCFFTEQSDCKYKYQSLLLIEDKNNSTIQIRGPGFC